MLPNVLRTAAARHFLGRATTGELVDVAHAVLHGGVYAYGLGEIATSRQPIMSDVGPLFQASLVELNAQVTSWVQAIEILTELAMVSIAEGPRTPHEIVCNVHDDCSFLAFDGLKRRERTAFGALAELNEIYYRYHYDDTPAWFEQVDRECIQLAKKWCRDRWFHACHPEWRTPTVMQLAQHIYDNRDFAQMPILADALQDAGCDNADILNHCRDASATHVRGCWVVDMVLGKE